MKMLAALTLIGPLMLTVPAGAQPAPTSTSARGTAVSDASVERDTYTRKAHDDVRDWRQKLHEFDVKAKTEGKVADKTAKADLSEALRKTEAASRKLRAAGAEGWDVAKADYEKAYQDLADTWHRNHPEHS